MLLAFGLEFMDDSLKSSEDVQRFVGLPTLGVIPAMIGWRPVVGGVGDVGNGDDMGEVLERPSLHAVTTASRANTIVARLPLLTKASWIMPTGA